MKPIKNPPPPPLGPGSAPDAIANLQDALLLVLANGRVQLADEERAALRDERQREEYRDATSRAVIAFREQQGLEPGEIVDERTAERLNALLGELGALETRSRESRHLISGKVQQEGGKPLGNVLVRAFHQVDGGLVRLGEDMADSAGHYTIAYTPPPEVDNITLLVRAFSEDGKSLEPSRYVSEAKPLEIVDLTMAAAVAARSDRILEGRIVFDNSLPAEGLNLRLYRVDFGGEATQLAETTTRELGLYDFPVFDFRGKAGALQIRAVNAEGIEQPLSKVIHDLGEEPRIIVNLVAETSLKPPAAEYQRLESAIAPQIGELRNLVDARETSDRRDLTLLNRATGWDARLIALAANAENLSTDEEVALPSEAVYGLLRAGLPSDKLQLAQVDPEVVAQVLTNVKDAGIVSLADTSIEEVKEQFSGFADRVRLGVTAPGSQATYRDLLGASGLEEDAQKKFASVYLKHRGDIDQLWRNSREAGLDDAAVKKLQLQGKLAFLTGNSVSMTRRLQDRLSTPEELVEQDYFLPSKWEEEVKAAAAVSADFNLQEPSESDRQKLEALIPSAYTGATLGKRLHAYGEDMARKVRLAYPTQVLGRRLERDSVNAFQLGEGRSSTIALLKNAVAAGFRLGETPVHTFFQENSAVLNTIENVETAKQNLTTLQRLSQITPSDDGVPVLMKLGFTSAYDVVALPEKDFIELYGSASNGITEARLIYRKAQQVSSVTYNLFTIAKTLDSEPALAAISGTPVQHAEAKEKLREALKNYPTMESLFGSTDFCECEHCRSVLSPAAYLVDLLQFIDTEPLVWGNFLAKWKKTHSNQEYTAKYKKPYDALIERRPDIPYISLTCENTNTALPYIDVVNEILEYYVSNSSLSEKAARNTGQTTTAELLAEPQNIISAAYNKLQQARYPLALPFDLWVETVRQFCDYFETPFWKLLEIFCPHSDLFAPTQPFDLASIFAEQLGLSPAELAIFANPAPLANWHQLYGYETEAAAATPALDAAGQRIDLNSAKALARRLGITYQEVAKVIETEFVNPKLANLTVLYRLEISVHDIFYYKENKEFYEKNEDLLGKERTELSAEDQQRFDQLSNKITTTDKTGWQVLSEVQGFLQRLETATTKFASFGFDAKAWLQTALEENEFAKVLVLADPAVGSNFDLTTLRYANGNGVDPIALLKINLFVRLWRKLGWTIEETDRALNVFLPKNAPFEPEHFAKQPLKTALIYLAHLKALDGEIKIGKDNRLKLLTFWSDLSRTGQRPLYAELFLTQAALKSGEVEITADGWSEHLSIFDHPLGQYLTAAGLQAMAERVKHEVFLFDVNEDNKIDPEPLAEEPKLSLRYDSLGEVQYLSYEGILSDSEKLRLIALSQSDNLATLLGAVQKKARDFSLVKTHVLALQGALGLTAEEIAGILKHAGISSETAELSLESLSLLYRYGTLAKALKLKLSDLIILKRLSGLDPFKPLHPEPLADVEQVDAPPLKAGDFDHLMTQTLAFVKMAKQIEGSGLKIEDLAYLLCHKYDETGKYRPGGDARVALLRTVCDGVRSIRIEHAVPADPSEESLRQKLSLVLTPNAVESLVGMVNRTTRLTETAARQFFDHELKKQKLRLSDEAGFLEEEDFQTLFKSLKPLLKIEVGDTAETIDEKGKQNEMIEEENRIELQLRRRRVAQAFLPFLQRRFIRQFVVQTVTAGTAASAALVEGFLTDERLLGTPQPLLESLAATGERGANVSFFDAGGANLGEQRLSPNADTGARDTEGKRLAPEGAKSARFEGYLEVPASGAYRFAIQFDKKGAEAELRFDELANLAGPFLGGVATDDGAEIGSEADKFIELQAGVPYQFAFDVKKLNEGDVRLLIQGTTLPKGPLAQLTLYPRNAFDNAANALILLTKGLQLAQTFNLSEREVRHLFNVNNPEGFDLSKLPHYAISDADFETARDRFTQLLNLTVYSDVKKDLGTETDDLVDVFEATQLDANRTAIARLTRREKVTVNLVIKALLGDNPPLITSQTKLSRLWQALHIVERIGVPVEALLEWTRIISPATLPAKRFAIAHDLKEALKAQLEPEAWLRVAQPIFDKLRQRQRDALVAFVKHQQGFVNIEQLYEYFLIDPGMEPVVQTSRIRLAISSLQLFIQRCLLNLEKKVHPSALNSKQWEWMKRYRVWEANRKIFLFPENWLEPEFRDDKTHLFTELESNLLQGDVSNDLVEDSFLNYLKRLEELARLEIVAMHLEDAADPANRRLHVFGRTFSLPYKYFYRRFAHQMWTPWEPVSAEIEGDHLAPVIWRDRLYLFWVTFFEQAEQPTPSAPSAISKVTAFSTYGAAQSNLLESGYLSAGNEKTEKKEKKLNEMTAAELTNAVISSAGTYAVEARLHWSEYLQGKWTMHESSGLDAPSPIVISGVTFFDRRKIFIHVSKEPFENGEERGVFIHLGLPINRAFYLAGRNSVPERGKFRPAPAMPYGASVVGAGRYFYKGALKVEYKRKITTEDGKDPVNAVETPGILQQGAAYTLLSCDNEMELGAPTGDALNTQNPEAVSRAIERGLPEIASLTRPFFYQDNAHTFFVEPDVEERTVEQWEEWVTRSPQPEVEVVPPLLWPEFIKPHIPKYKVPTPIDPDDPIWRSPIHHDSILKAGARNDWLVNSATALLYQGELIGPVGKARVIVRAGVGAETFGAEESGEIALTIHAGSALTAGSILVAEESDALDQAGLAQATVPLSIVGGGGFNSALAQSFVAGLNSPGVVTRRIHR